MTSKENLKFGWEEINFEIHDLTYPQFFKNAPTDENISSRYGWLNIRTSTPGQPLRRSSAHQSPSPCSVCRSPVGSGNIRRQLPEEHQQTDDGDLSLLDRSGQYQGDRLEGLGDVKPHVGHTVRRHLEDRRQKLPFSDVGTTGL